MKTSPAMMAKCLTLSMLCMLSAEGLADGLLNCGGTPHPAMSPALKRAQEHACAASRVAIVCTKNADEKKLSGKAREDFINRCEGISSSGGKKGGR